MVRELDKILIEKGTVLKFKKVLFLCTVSQVGGVSFKARNNESQSKQGSPDNQSMANAK